MTDKELLKRLSDPFPECEVQWKPSSVSKDGRKAMALAYIDARSVADRLDQVLGLDWSDSYEVFPSGSVCCTLTITLNGKSTSRQDIGKPSGQPDGGDKLKAAYSDALKRCATKFGIGRYLYSLPRTWVDLNERSQIDKGPRLPAWAIPGGTGLPPGMEARWQAEEGDDEAPKPDQPAKTQGASEELRKKLQSAFDNLIKIGLVKTTGEASRAIIEDAKKSDHVLSPMWIEWTDAEVEMACTIARGLWSMANSKKKTAS
jgi:hypothetical protein